MDNIDKFIWISIEFAMNVSKIVSLNGMNGLDQYFWSKNNFKQKMVKFRVNNFTCCVYCVQPFQLEKQYFRLVELI